MFVKRTVKVEMPKLKRCKTEEDEKLKTEELFTVPIKELEDYRTSLVDSFCREALSYAGEVESSLALAGASRSLEKAFEVHNHNKPPLLKSSRGLIQVPLKLKQLHLESVHANWPIFQIFARFNLMRT